MEPHNNVYQPQKYEGGFIQKEEREKENYRQKRQTLFMFIQTTKSFTTKAHYSLGFGETVFMTGKIAAMLPTNNGTMNGD